MFARTFIKWVKPHPKKKKKKKAFWGDCVAIFVLHKRLLVFLLIHWIESYYNHIYAYTVRNNTNNFLLILIVTSRVFQWELLANEKNLSIEVLLRNSVERGIKTEPLASISSRWLTLFVGECDATAIKRLPVVGLACYPALPQLVSHRFFRHHIFFEVFETRFYGEYSLMHACISQIMFSPFR